MRFVVFDNQNVKWMFNNWLQIKTLFLIYNAVQKFGVTKDFIVLLYSACRPARMH